MKMMNIIERVAGNNALCSEEVWWVEEGWSHPRKVLTYTCLLEEALHDMLINAYEGWLLIIGQRHHIIL